MIKKLIYLKKKVIKIFMAISIVMGFFLLQSSDHAIGAIASTAPVPVSSQNHTQALINAQNQATAAAVQLGVEYSMGILAAKISSQCTLNALSSLPPGCSCGNMPPASAAGMSGKEVPPGVVNRATDPLLGVNSQTLAPPPSASPGGGNPPSILANGAPSAISSSGSHNSIAASQQLPAADKNTSSNAAIVPPSAPSSVPPSPELKAALEAQTKAQTVLDNLNAQLVEATTAENAAKTSFDQASAALEEAQNNQDQNNHLRTEAETILKETINAIAESNKSITALQAQLKPQQKAIEKANKDKNKYQGGGDKLQKKLQSAQQQFSKAEAEKTAAENADVAQDEVIKDLQSKLDEAQQNLDLGGKPTAEDKKQFKNAQGALKKAQKEKAGIKKRLDKTLAVYNKESTEFDAIQKQYQDYEAELAKMTQTAESQIAALADIENKLTETRENLNGMLMPQKIQTETKLQQYKANQLAFSQTVNKQKGIVTTAEQFLAAASKKRQSLEDAVTKASQELKAAGVKVDALKEIAG